MAAAREDEGGEQGRGCAERGHESHGVVSSPGFRERRSFERAEDLGARRVAGALGDLRGRSARDVRSKRVGLRGQKKKKKKNTNA